MTNREWVFLGLCVLFAAWRPIWGWAKRLHANSFGNAADTTQQKILECLRHMAGETMAMRSASGPTLDKLTELAGTMGRIEAALASIKDQGERIETHVEALDVGEHHSAHRMALRINTQFTRESLEKMVTLLNESVSQTKGVMRAMMGTAGTDDDDVIERALALKQQYPEKLATIEEAIEAARKMRTYAR